MELIAVNLPISARTSKAALSRVTSPIIILTRFLEVIATVATKAIEREIERLKFLEARYVVMNAPIMQRTGRTLILICDLSCDAFMFDLASRQATNPARTIPTVTRYTIADVVSPLA
jgi:hypothetical protein